MESFIGRRSELAVLEKQYESKNGFVVLYGRSRVGKTTLIKEFIKGKTALYFLASREAEALNIRRFAGDMAGFVGQPALKEGNYTDWRPLFKAFADHEASERKVLVIDELPYLVKGNPAFPSVLQYAWDELLRDANVMLVICGSSVHMMRDVALSHDSPLYGRRTAQIRLKPMRFSEMASGFPEYGFSDLVDLFALTGGVPKYFEFFEPIDRFEECVKENVFSTSGFLYEEPRFLLDEDIRDPVNYLSILRAVSAGNRRQSDIAGMLGKKTGEMSPYLKTLAGLGFIERRVPFTEKYPERSKSGLYYICDTFVDFWFRYVQPFTGELEMGNMRPSLEAVGRTFQSNFVPFVFETVSRQAFADLCAAGQIDFAPSRIGSYWNRRGSVEIDVGAVDNSSGRCFFGECKYREREPVSMGDFEVLRVKAESVPGPFDAPPLFGLFSRTGFSKELRAHAAGTSDVVLVNENEVVEG